MSALNSGDSCEASSINFRYFAAAAVDDVWDFDMLHDARRLSYDVAVMSSRCLSSFGMAAFHSYCMMTSSFDHFDGDRKVEHSLKRRIEGSFYALGTFFVVTFVSHWNFLK